GRRSSAFVREDSGCTAHTSCQSRRGRPVSARKERNWVQRVVADGHAICILPERSAAAPGLVTRPIEGLFGAGIGDRDGLGIDHSGRDTEDRATRLEVRMAVRTVAAVPRRYGNYTRSPLENFVPRCDV